jgi:copper(I)-binding protein
VVITTAAGSRARTRSMHRLRLHRACLLALVAATCLALAGCSTGFRDQTNQQYQAAAGISDRSHDVYVLNALVVTDGNGNGTMVGTLINQSKTADTLQSVSATDAKGKTIATKLTSPVTLKPAQAVKLETGGAVRITSSALKAGYFINVTFSFASAAPVQVSIPVLVNGPDYTAVPVGPT